MCLCGRSAWEIEEENRILPCKEKKEVVLVVAQWLANPTRNCEVSGSIPGLAHGVKDPALPRAMV